MERSETGTEADLRYEDEQRINEIRTAVDELLKMNSKDEINEQVKYIGGYIRDLELGSFKNPKDPDDTGRLSEIKRLLNEFQGGEQDKHDFKALVEGYLRDLENSLRQ